MATTTFKNLIVWQKSRDLAVNMYKITENFPKSELYGLTSQMRRAAISIPSNIAEGAERDSRLDYIRILRIAKGSAAELRTQSYIAARLNLLDKKSASHVSDECKEIAAMLQGLIRSLRAPKPNP